MRGRPKKPATAPIDPLNIIGSRHVVYRGRTGEIEYDPNEMHYRISWSDGRTDTLDVERMKQFKPFLRNQPVKENRIEQQLAAAGFSTDEIAKIIGILENRSH